MIIKEYAGAEEYLRIFQRGNMNLVFLIGKAGYGKTSLMRKVMGNPKDYLYINTKDTPLNIHKNLYERKDQPVVFDDTKGLIQNKTNVSILMALCDTLPEKEIHYGTTSSLLGTTPQTFKTKSNVCVILNELDTESELIQPLLDRGFVIEFKPTRKEIMKKIREISKYQSITVSKKCVSVLKFFERNYEKFDVLSLRTYVKALQIYKDNPQKWIVRFMALNGFDGKTIEYLRLKKKYKKVEAMTKEFEKNGFGNRATFFRTKKEVEG